MNYKINTTSEAVVFLIQLQVKFFNGTPSLGNKFLQAY